MFCFPRQFFTSSTSYKDTAFTDKGVMDWKNIRKKLDEHSSTNSHMDCMVRWNEYKNSQKKGSITTQMSKSHEDAVAENWKYAEKITEALIFLARQGLAPGHDESHGSMNRGNFLELCSLFGKYDLKFAERLDRHLNLTRHASQIELLTIAAHQLIETLSNDVHTAGFFFCLMADEARSFIDEQLAVCIRYAVDLDIRERFVIFVDCSKCRDAEEITGQLLKALSAAGLYDVPTIARAYDGAGVMSGKHNGVQKKIRDLHPAAVYMHCMAHKLNLVIVASCMTTRQVVIFFDNLQSLYVFFHDLETRGARHISKSTDVDGPQRYTVGM